jgi:hypothetical protein
MISGLRLRPDALSADAMTLNENKGYIYAKLELIILYGFCEIYSQ